MHLPNNDLAIGLRELTKRIDGAIRDQILGSFGLVGLVGLERQPTTLAQALPAVGLITVSGAGTDLVTPPTSGVRLCARLSGGIDHTKHRLSEHHPL